MCKLFLKNVSDDWPIWPLLLLTVVYVEIMNLCTCCVLVKSVSSVIHCYSSMFLHLSTFKVNWTITVYVASIQRIQTLLYDSGSHSGCFFCVAKCVQAGSAVVFIQPYIYRWLSSLGLLADDAHHFIIGIGRRMAVCSAHFGGGSALQRHVSC